MLILGIETSCDETAAALVKDGTKVLSSVVISSQDLHKKYGGIIPEEAAREQVKCIIPVINEAITKTLESRPRRLDKKTLTPKSYCLLSKIEAIAVTTQPGLIGSLLIGVEAAKTLSFALKKPIVPVNHLLAHIYANFIEEEPELPAICLVVSGGHSEIYLMKSHQKINWLGGTRDDAAGECFDKCARLLGLGYPGGPAIEAYASKLKTHPPAGEAGSSKLKVKFKNLKLPRPMLNQDNFDFSFSGLKTSVAQLIQKSHQPLTINHQSLMAFEFQEAITDCLVGKTLKAAEKFKPKSILIAGGVAANQRLREKLKFAIRKLDNLQINLFLPDKNLCTDNAVTTASRAFFNFKPIPWRKVKANPNLVNES